MPDGRDLLAVARRDEQQNPSVAADHEASADKQRAPAPVPYKHTHLQGPRPQKTPFLVRATAAVCAILWLSVIVSGVAVLVVYLVFRPRSPRLEISSATLNGAYLDMGTLLNADLTILANFTNPNHKVDVSFSYLTVDLYYATTLIATRAIEPFAAASGETVIRTVHMVSSEVALATGAAQGLRKQVENELVEFRMEGTFRTRLDLGSFLHFSYWLYSTCTVVVSSPPSGVLLSSKCRTKR
ncbi:hypothetical protein Taro_002588 [Colocasia esculenta]|uniref:Late embryogenesis abundant protein LEA-2 subgroup domain-containing protein n=1 Tax=Colocasia esculenta TaxID=4460 RepID=A0A843TLB8_COLES|nr:hypothetical protein [Colocasia esculenta]